MDADDIAHVDRIALEAEVLNRLPSVNLVFSDFSAFVTGMRDYEVSHIGTYYNSFKGRGGATKLFLGSTTVRSPHCDQQESVSVWYGNQFDTLIWGNFVHQPTIMVRKRALDTAGALDTSLRSGADYEYILRIARAGQIAYLDKPLLRYRRGAQQMSASFVKGESWQEYRQILEKFKLLEPTFFDHHRTTYLQIVANTYFEEAMTIGNKNRLKSLHLLILSMQNAILLKKIGRAILYILIPEIALTQLRTYRQLRRKKQAAKELNPH
jgi:hypothetical protein